MPRPPEEVAKEDSELRNNLTIVEEYLPGWDLPGCRMIVEEIFQVVEASQLTIPPKVRAALLVIRRCEELAASA